MKRVAALLLGGCLLVNASGMVPDINTQYQIKMTPTRKKLTLDYIRQHYDPTATSINFTPVMIVIHWTVIPTLQSTLKAFQPETLPGRADIRQAGLMNVGTQFIVDRDGKIYRLYKDTTITRHVIGLNRKAIGIENVGRDDLTKAQLQANVALVQYLASRYPIQYLIGHYEYGAFRKSPLWEERDPNYFTVKIDPGERFMRDLRAELAQKGITLKRRP